MCKFPAARRRRRPTRPSTRDGTDIENVVEEYNHEGHQNLEVGVSSWSPATPIKYYTRNRGWLPGCAPKAFALPGEKPLRRWVVDIPVSALTADELDNIGPGMEWRPGFVRGRWIDEHRTDCGIFVWRVLFRDSFCVDVPRDVCELLHRDKAKQEGLDVDSQTLPNYFCTHSKASSSFCQLFASPGSKSYVGVDEDFVVRSVDREQLHLAKEYMCT